MKLFFLVLIFALSVGFSQAQTVKPYITKIKTKDGVIRGLLYKVDSASVIILADHNFSTVDISEIKSIKIRTPKKPYEIVQFVKYDPWSEDNFEKRTDGLKVRKWGEKDPTLGEEIGGHFYGTLFNVIGNIFAAPIHSINPSIANYKINGSLQKFAEQKAELNYFSVYYQSNLNIVAETNKIKAISAGFKP
ncbi:hypothetical protein [Pedobacter paludis]|uniref:DUF4369 domain-containing protein n=1 Tax=Pedobacter paludis TaxID=2203212 RepID=A0A317EY87_9SPHI|nr:hypothetical protein [Pedobacter paludis]PWS31372.1 hypothetical protein DF947_12270 [Pedobacter paludis]